MKEIEKFEIVRRGFARIGCAFVMAAKGVTAPGWHAFLGAVAGGMAAEHRKLPMTLGCVVGGAVGLITGTISAANSIVEAPLQLVVKTPCTTNTTDRFLLHCLG